MLMYAVVRSLVSGISGHDIHEPQTVQAHLTMVSPSQSQWQAFG